MNAGNGTRWTHTTLVMALLLAQPAGAHATVVAAEISPPAPGGPTYVSGSETASLSSATASASIDLLAGTLRALASTSAPQTSATARAAVDSLYLTSADPLPFEIGPGQLGIAFDAVFDRTRPENLLSGSHFLSVLLEVGQSNAAGPIASARAQLSYTIDMVSGAITPIIVETGGGTVALTASSADAVAGRLLMPAFTVSSGDRLSVQAVMFANVDVSPVYDESTGEVVLPLSEWPEGTTDGFNTARLFLSLPPGASLSTDTSAALGWVTPVPEPVTTWLLIGGLALVAMVRSRALRVGTDLTYTRT